MSRSECFMVVAVFPLAKIGLLLLRQLSKPMANFIKNNAKKHPQIRKYVIVPTGRAFGWVENRVQARVKGMKPSEVEPLTEEEAVELGSNAIGEIILFGILSLLLVLEYNRQGDKKAVLEKTKEEEFYNLQEALIDIMEEVEKVKAAVNKIQLEMQSTWDALEMEEVMHHASHDYAFLDVMTSRKLNKKKKPKQDLSSPSI